MPKLIYLLYVRPYWNVLAYNGQQLLASVLCGCAGVFALVLVFNRAGLISIPSGGDSVETLANLVCVLLISSIVAGLLVRFPLPEHLRLLGEAVPGQIRILLACGVLLQVFDVLGLLCRGMLLITVCQGLHVTGSRTLLICAGYVLYAVLGSSMTVTLQVIGLTCAGWWRCIAGLLMLSWPLAGISSYQYLPDHLATLMPNALVFACSDRGVLLGHCILVMCACIIALWIVAMVLLARMPVAHFFENADVRLRGGTDPLVPGLAPAWLTRRLVISTEHSGFRNLAIHGIGYSIHDREAFGRIAGTLVAVLLFLVLMRTGVWSGLARVSCFCLVIGDALLAYAMSGALALRPMLWIVRMSRFDLQKAGLAYGLGSGLVGGVAAGVSLIAMLIVDHARIPEPLEMVTLLVWSVVCLWPTCVVAGQWIQAVVEGDALTNRIPYLFRQMVVNLVFVVVVFLPGIFCAVLAGVPPYGFWAIHALLAIALVDIFLGNAMRRGILRALIR